MGEISQENIKIEGLFNLGVIGFSRDLEKRVRIGRKNGNKVPMRHR